jgi:hypothetical protein
MLVSRSFNILINANRRQRSDWYNSSYVRAFHPHVGLRIGDFPQFPWGRDWRYMAARKYASGTGAADRDDAKQVSHHSRIQTLILEAGKTKAMSDHPILWIVGVSIPVRVKGGRREREMGRRKILFKCANHALSAASFSTGIRLVRN